MRFINTLMIIIGVITIIMALKNPEKLLKMKKERLNIENEEAFFSKFKMLNFILGFICVLTGILGVLELIPNYIIIASIIILTIISNIINSLLIRAITKK